LKGLFNRGPADGSWLVSKPTYNRQGGAPDERPQLSTNLPGKSSPSGGTDPRGVLGGGRSGGSQRGERADRVQVAGAIPRRGRRGTPGPQLSTAANADPHSRRVADIDPRAARQPHDRTPDRGAAGAALRDGRAHPAAGGHGT